MVLHSVCCPVQNLFFLVLFPTTGYQRTYPRGHTFFFFLTASFNFLTAGRPLWRQLSPTHGIGLKVSSSESPEFFPSTWSTGIFWRHTYRRNLSIRWFNARERDRANFALHHTFIVVGRVSLTNFKSTIWDQWLLTPPPKETARVDFHRPLNFTFSAGIRLANMDTGADTINKPAPPKAEVQIVYIPKFNWDCTMAP